MCGALSNEASVSVAALAKSVWGRQPTAANENKQNGDNDNLGGGCKP